MISKSYVIENDGDFLTKNNSILFYGENVGLKKDFKQKIKSLNHNTFFLNLDQDEITKNQSLLENQVANASLFDEKKIIFINQASDKIFELINEILEVETNNKIVLFAEILDKKSKLRSFYEKSKKHHVVACYADNALTIKNIILKKLKDFEGLNSYNIDLILDNSNLDRIKLQNELEKIITYFQNKKIDSTKLSILLDEKINDDFNILRDEALMGNKVKTNILLSDTILDAEKNVYYLNLINQRINKLKDLNFSTERTNLEELINNLKPPIFWKDKPNFFVQARKWNLKKIKTLLKKTYNLEIEFKSNAMINKNILIKKLITDICDLANS